MSKKENSNYIEWLIKANQASTLANEVAKIWGDTLLSPKLSVVSRTVQTGSLFLGKYVAKTYDTWVTKLSEDLQKKYPYPVSIGFSGFEEVAKLLQSKSLEDVLIGGTVHGNLMYSRLIIDSEVSLGIIHYKAENPKEGHPTGWRGTWSVQCTHNEEVFKETLQRVVFEKYAGCGLRYVDESNDPYEDKALQVLKRPTRTVVNDTTFGVSISEIALRSQRFTSAGFKRTILLYGPPGNGKTTLAREIATHISNGTYLSYSINSILKSSCRIVADCCQDIPIIIEDIDRVPIKNLQQLLEALDTNYQDTSRVILLTCNTLVNLDQAMLRSGRVDEFYEVGYPNEDFLRKLTAVFTNLEEDSSVITELISNFKDLSIAEVQELCNAWKVVGMDDFEWEVTRVRRQAELTRNLGYINPYKEEEEAYANTPDEPSPER